MRKTTKQSIDIKYFQPAELLYSQLMYFTTLFGDVTDGKGLKKGVNNNDI